MYQWYNLNQKNVYDGNMYVIKEMDRKGVAYASISDGWELILGQGITDRRTEVCLDGQTKQVDIF
jgi:hypothetical protein